MFVGYLWAHASNVWCILNRLVYNDFFMTVMNPEDIQEPPDWHDLVTMGSDPALLPALTDKWLTPGELTIRERVDQL